MRRRDFGNTPNTSKSLRLLVSSRTVARAGQGGRVDAFRYSIPSDVLAAIAPGSTGAHQDAAAASPPAAGMDGAAGPSRAVQDLGNCAGATPGAQAARFGGHTTPTAPAKPDPAQACTRLTHPVLLICLSMSSQRRCIQCSCDSVLAL